MNERKGIPLIVLILILIVIIGLGGFLISKLIFDKKENNLANEEVNLIEPKKIISEEEAYTLVDKMYSKVVDISYNFPAEDFKITEQNYEGGYREVTNYYEVVNNIFTKDALKIYEEDAKEVLLHHEEKNYIKVATGVLGIDHIGRVYTNFVITEDMITCIVDNQYRKSLDSVQNVNNPNTETEVNHVETELVIRKVDGRWLVDKYTKPE